MLLDGGELSCRPAAMLILSKERFRPVIVAWTCVGEEDSEATPERVCMDESITL